MSTTFNKFIHAYVTVQLPPPPTDALRAEQPPGYRGRPRWAGCQEEAWSGTHAILLHTGTHVWVPGSYCHEGHPEILRVGTGQDKGYDEDGNCVLAVPVAWCEFYSEEDAETIERCLDADERLLGYAR